MQVRGASGWAASGAGALAPTRSPGRMSISQPKAGVLLQRNITRAWLSNTRETQPNWPARPLSRLVGRHASRMRVKLLAPEPQSLTCNAASAIGAQSNDGDKNSQGRTALPGSVSQ